MTKKALFAAQQSLHPFGDLNLGVELPNSTLFGCPALISLFCPSVEMPEFYLFYRAESGWDHLEGIVSAVTANINFIPLPQSLVLDSALIVFFTARSKQPQCSKKPSEHNTAAV